MKLKRYELHQTQYGASMRPDETDGEWVDADEAQSQIESLLSACRVAFDSIMKHCAETGDVIWVDPPHQLAFVHESLCERLRNAIAQAEGLSVEEI